MVCLDLDHPEVMEFINWKVEEEKKVALIYVVGFSKVNRCLIDLAEQWPPMSLSRTSSNGVLSQIWIKVAEVISTTAGIQALD